MGKQSLNNPSIFTKMSQLAQSLGAINLAQGFPNMPIDPRLKDCIANAAQSEQHQYSPYQGLPELRYEIAALIERNGTVSVDPNEVLVTAGATQAIYTSVQALVSAGEEVILLDPCYDCYALPALMVGAKVRHVALNENYLPDWNKVEAVITERTRLIIINSPHNPSGRVWEEHEYKALASLVEKFPRLLLLSDEVYEYLAFDKPHFSVRNVPRLKERSVVVSSFGKSLQATGWKMGYLTAPKEILTSILYVHQFLIFSVNSFLQKGIATYLRAFNPDRVRADYAHRKALFTAQMKPSKFELLPCEGTYFQTVCYSNISHEKDLDFAERLAHEVGVAAIPVSAFNEDERDLKHLRLCFAKTEETLTEAAQRLCSL